MLAFSKKTVNQCHGLDLCGVVGVLSCQWHGHIDWDETFPGARTSFSPPTPVGSERPGVWNSAAEESPARAYCSVLRLLTGSGGEDLDHLHGVHARGKSWHRQHRRRSQSETGGFLSGFVTCRDYLNCVIQFVTLRYAPFSYWLYNATACFLFMLFVLFYFVFLSVLYVNYILFVSH